MLRNTNMGIGSTNQNAIHHLFIDHAEHNYIDNLYKIDLSKANQPAPVVNMVAIHQILDDSLYNILNESPGVYSEGSTVTTQKSTHQKSQLQNFCFNPMWWWVTFVGANPSFALGATQLGYIISRAWCIVTSVFETPMK